uniref:Anthocyanidin 3-O-glucosyltransferase n=1 Tax=Cajanus cajan TaxID=3821 RepID=A0A151QQ04_CAJCA|nr:Anthocyanidin 3-O-glucosyltransferase [Cajanus cajan]
MDEPHLQLHIAMYPWLAMGHITAYLHLANKLAKRRHRISFFIPKRTQAKVEHFNLYPHLIIFIPITIPHVDGLPLEAETTFDITLSIGTLLMTAMDRTQNDIQLLLLELKPHIVFFDLASWIPSLTRSLGIKSLHYITLSLIFEYGFPDSSIKLQAHEVRVLVSFIKSEFGRGFSFYDRISIGTRFADAIGFRGCSEIEGPFAEFLQSFYGKPLLLSGPVLPEPSTTTLEPKWVEWLDGFKAGSVIYCAFGSECRMVQDQFKELLLGLELTGFPFLAALKAPIGFESVEEAMPEGFKERVHGRGIVHGGWV